MAKLTAAQDKALKAFAESTGGDFPKGTRSATIEGIRAAGLIFQWNGDGSWDLTGDGREYLGLEAIANVKTSDQERADMLAEASADVAEIEELLKPAQNLPGLATMAHYEREGWRNTSVWNGLSAIEIEQDIMTAVPVGRAAMRMRKHAKHNH